MKRSIFLTVIFSLSLITSNFVNAVDKNKVINAGLIVGGITFILFDKFYHKPKLKELFENYSTAYTKIVAGDFYKGKQADLDGLNAECKILKKKQNSQLIKIFGSALTLIGLYRSLPQNLRF